jgi:hypothetical protein
MDRENRPQFVQFLDLIGILSLVRFLSPSLVFASRSLSLHYTFSP